MKRTVVLMVLLAVGCGGAPRSPGKRPHKPGPWLWQVRVGDKVSYLFALPPPQVRVDELPPLVWTTLRRSKAYYGTYGAHTSVTFTLPEGGSLKTLLGERDWARLLHAGELLFFNHAGLAKLQPGAAAKLLLVPKPPTATAPARLRRRANANHLAVGHLIEFERGFKVETRMRGVEYLRAVVADVPRFRAKAAEEAAAYRRGDVAALRRAAHADDPYTPAAASAELYDEIYGTTVVARLERVFAQGGAFAALPWRPLLRKRGVLARLRAAGIELRRVASDQPPTVPLKRRTWNSYPECRKAIAHWVELMPTEEAREKRGAFVNTCLGLARRPFVTCVQAASTNEDALECYRVAWYEMFKRTGQDATPFTKEAFYKKVYGAAYTMITRLEELARQACECRDKWCASEVAEDTFALTKRHRQSAASPEQQATIETISTRLTECLLERGVDHTWFQDRLDEALGD